MQVKTKEVVIVHLIESGKRKHAKMTRTDKYDNAAVEISAARSDLFTPSPASCLSACPILLTTGEELPSADEARIKKCSASDIIHPKIF